MKHELELLEALAEKDFDVYFKLENGRLVFVVEDDNQIIEAVGFDNFAALGQMFADIMKEKAEEE